MNQETITSNATDATYQWLDCDDNFSMLAGETTDSYTAIVSGNYACVIDNGCELDTTDCVTVTIVGINEYVQNELTVFPNPASNWVTINGVAPNTTIRLLDLNGSMVKTSVGNVFSVSELPAGVYILEAATNTEIIRSRFVKQ